ncbi:putative glycosyltransferase EpsE [compost metagenome]
MLGSGLFGRLRRSFEVLFAQEPIAPLISVVIPIYDRVEPLRESIESILGQTYRRFELLLVCDGSPAETLEVVEAYRHHPQVRIFIFPDNSGNAVRGRNLAIREAKGEYLAFQDSDDIAHPQRLARSLRHMTVHGADVVYGAWRVKLEDPSRAPHLKDGQLVLSPDCDYEQLRRVCVPCQSTVMARLAALRAVGGVKPKMRYLEDYELWMRLAYYGYKFKSVSRLLTTLRLHSSNLEAKYAKEFEHFRSIMEQEHRIISNPPDFLND